MTQNLAPDISNSVNTVFSEQRVVESQPAFKSSTMILPQSVENEMTDETWFAKQQLMKPVQLAQVQWSATNARDSELYTCSFPNVLSSVESIVLRTLRMYAYFKMTPCFRIQINSTQFHQGQLICSFDPFSISSRATTGIGDYYYDIFYASGLPNVKIMASESDAVELCIPFIHPVSFWTTNDADPFMFQNLGEFRISVLNPLIVADGTSPSVTVTVWVYAKDAQVHVPIFDHQPILDPGTNQLQATYGISDITSSISSIAQEASSKLSPVLSSVRKGASQAHTLIGNIASGNIGQALRTGQGIVDTLGDLFGFDYPARTLQPPKTISPVENLSVGIGQSQSQRMAIDPFSLHLVEDDVAGESKSAMDLLAIAKMPMLLSQFAYTGTSAQDSLLFQTPVTPTVSCLRSNGLLRRTYLSTVSNAFCYWNGGINFDIEIVATRFHSGKLLFAFVPNDSDTPSYGAAADGLPNIIIDLQQTSSTRFKVPFVSPRPLKDVQRLNPTFSILPSPIPADIYYTSSCIGTLVCYVQNVLNYASNVSPTVEINIYISAADDFGLYVPARPAIDLIPFVPPALEATSNEVGIDLNKNNEPVTAAVLSKGQLESIPRKHFGENYALIDIIRRFTYQNSFSLTGISPIGYPVTPLNDDIAPKNSCYIQYFSYLYSAYCGSIRYKFVTDTTRSQNLPLQIVHVPSTPAAFVVGSTPTITALIGSGFGILRTNAQQDCAIEAEVPYYSKFNMLVHHRRDFPDVANNGAIFLQTTATATNVNTNVDVYIAAGEDFRFIYVRPFVNDTTNIGYHVTSL